MDPEDQAFYASSDRIIEFKGVHARLEWTATFQDGWEGENLSRPRPPGTYELEVVRTSDGHRYRFKFDVQMWDGYLGSDRRQTYLVVELDYLEDLGCAAPATSAPGASPAIQCTP